MCSGERVSPEIIGSLFVFIIINLHFELSLEIFVSSACGLKLATFPLFLENAKERMKIENFHEWKKALREYKTKGKYSTKILNARTNKRRRGRSYYIIALQIIVAWNPFG